MWMYFPRDTNNIQLIIIDINRLHFVKCKVMVVINSHYQRMGQRIQWEVFCTFAEAHSILQQVWMQNTAYHIISQYQTP